MTPEGGPGVVVDIVADEVDIVSETERLDGFQEEEISGTVIADQFRGGGAFGGAVLDMVHVDVEPSPVEQKPAVSSGFIPVTVVLVDQTVAMVVEEPVADPGKNLLGGEMWIVHQTAILRFQA